MFPFSSKSREFHCVAALVCVLAFPSAGFPQAKITKQAPETVMIFLDDGADSTFVDLRISGKAEEPQVVLSDAIGPSGVIPRSDIHWNWKDGFPKSDKAVLTRGEIAVTAHGYVEPGAEYKGKVIFIWPDTPTPVQFEFSIKPRAESEFAISPESLDVFIGPYQPRSVTLRVRNSGKSVIRELTVSSLGLTDPTQKHSTGPFAAPGLNSQALRLEPGMERDIFLGLPLPALAGSYAGQLDVRANGRVRKSIPMILRTRGPNRIPALSNVASFSYLPRLPFLLFLAVLFLGFVLATVIENWFAQGGLQQAEAVLSLRRTQEALKGMVKCLDEWQLHHAGGQPAFVQNRTNIRLSMVELETLLADPMQTPLETLTEAAPRLARGLPYYAALWTAVVVATEKWSGNATELVGVVKSLDQASGADVNAYLAELRKILEKASAPQQAAAAADNLAIASRLPKETKIDATTRELRLKVKWMARLNRALVWVAVSAFAYLTFYSAKFSFGSFSDYINLFLWALGLTPTGTLILARARSSYTKPT